MSPGSTDRLELNRLAGRQAQLDGELGHEGMTRLNEAVLSVDGPVRYRLEFEYDDARRPTVRGQIDARVTMSCQRCLQPMQVSLQAEPALAAVIGEHSAADLPEDVEPLECEDWSVALATLLEDELLLVLPLAPMHEPGARDAPQCLPWQADDAGPDSGDEERRFPFAGLADRLKDTD